MGKTILFSPVGGTDPVHEINLRDGAMLHIARIYKPDVIYLYLSNEMLQNEENADDHRYSYCLERLGEKIGHSFEIRKICRPDLKEVQLFNTIYQDFETELGKILAEVKGDDRLLLNLSSGTHAMKSALLVLATMIDIPCACIQVDTPAKKMNFHQHSENITGAELWELDEDNDPTVFVDRTHIERLESLRRLKLEEVIRKSLENYDYAAALRIAQEVPAEETAGYLNKLKAAKARQMLNKGAVNELLKTGLDPAIYCPVKHDKVRDIFEYTLMLQAKEKQENYADFVRALSPLFTRLFFDYLEHDAGIKKEDVTVLSNGVLRWKEKAQLDANSPAYPILMGVKNDGSRVVMNNTLSDLVISLCNSKIQNEVGKMRDVEKKVRNIAAHEIVMISKETVKGKCGKTCEEILNLIYEAFELSSFNIGKKEWKSYDRMNEDIIRSMRSVENQC